MCLQQHPLPWHPWKTESSQRPNFLTKCVILLLHFNYFPDNRLGRLKLAGEGSEQGAELLLLAHIYSSPTAAWKRPDSQLLSHCALGLP